MKSMVKMMVIVLLGTLACCGQKEKPLYDQVLEIHDEVMPKMSELYKMKKSLQDSIAKTPGMSGEVKIKLEQKILQVDSASESMMVWMREFNPPEQKDKKAFEKYMETELVKVKKMRDRVMMVLDSKQEQH
jgi:hypothetical protein